MSREAAHMNSGAGSGGTFRFSWSSPADERSAVRSGQFGTDTEFEPEGAEGGHPPPCIFETMVAAHQELAAVLFVPYPTILHVTDSVGLEFQTQVLPDPFAGVEIKPPVRGPLDKDIVHGPDRGDAWSVRRRFKARFPSRRSWYPPKPLMNPTRRLPTL